MVVVKKLIINLKMVNGVIVNIQVIVPNILKKVIKMNVQQEN